MATAAAPAPAAQEDRGVVYGLHAFAAENQDEISFGPGEKVVVLEKDDQYGDGWWQVSPYNTLGA